MNSQEILVYLKSQKNLKNIAGMARFGISSKNTLGVSVSNLRSYAKEIKKSVKQPEDLHDLALTLWESGIHEARMLATILAQPKLTTEVVADRWVKGIESWDICDGFCLNLIDKTDFAIKKVYSWAESEEEFVRRSAFSLIAGLAVHRKDLENAEFEKFFPLIEKYSTDPRNFVKKAVNWALRQIGKRNDKLLVLALETAHKIEKLDSKSAKWVAKDAIRELKPRL